MISLCQVQTIVALAKEVGRAILEVYGEEDFGISLKFGQSPVTRADRVAHHLILSGLQALTPDLPVLSEESKTIPYPQRQHWKAYWLVDPLDGTKEFIQRNGEFTVNIALIENNHAVVGVVHAPVLDLTYYATRAGGAFMQRSAESPIQIRVRDHSGGKLRVVASRSHGSEALEHFLQKLRDYRCVSMGSSLKFCLVAEGSAHLYPRLGPTMEWDTAAGHCIVEAAGGAVTDLQGNSLDYNKSNLLNPHFMVSSTSAMSWLQFLGGMTQSRSSPPS
ncbi:MAG: 3'(2'),5'-bisphosphate nucleotidase [Acidobacteria bacterium]|nr:MAG: 3'(2'),5'-bisphosphate nucleotidase [Acidobacteriota bacterium]